MPFLKSYPMNLPSIALVTLEVETVALMRRVAQHPSFMPAVVAFNLALARMAREIRAHDAGDPAPFPTVETSIKQILSPLAHGTGEAGLTGVFPDKASFAKAFEQWATSGEFTDP